MEPSVGHPQDELALFSEIVRHVIRTDGFERFSPTVFFPARHEVRILDDLHGNDDAEHAALNRAMERAEPGEEFLVAVKVGRLQFKVIRRQGPDHEEALFDVDPV